MEALNYLRSAKIEVSKYLSTIDSKNNKVFIEKSKLILERAGKAQKFIIPENGKILDDGYKGLPDILMLPFKDILLEFQVNEETTNNKKVIIYAHQTEPGVVLLNTFSYSDKWTMAQYTLNIERAVENVRKPGRLQCKIENITLNCGCGYIGDSATIAFTDVIKEKAIMTSGGYIRALFEFLEALSCSNVGYSPLLVRKLNKAAQKKGAASFDTYNVLVIKNNAGKLSENEPSLHSGSAKREHLRRGHIRVYSDGKKIWVQSCVVNAGIGGKINKMYVVK